LLDPLSPTGERETYSPRSLVLSVAKLVPRRIRRRLFGRDPEAYDRARLQYPEKVYEILTTRCGLRRGSAVFEIGPGTGIVTRTLLKLGADPMTLIEPDRRLARYLAGRLGRTTGHVTISTVPFERVKLPRGRFDLGVAAASFHWVPERFGLRRVARALRPGGWWATWNSHYADPYRRGAFRRALQPLYRELSGRPEPPYLKGREAKDRRDRLRALESVGEFDRISRTDIRWTATLSTTRVQALWGTFSDILALPPTRRDWFLRELGRIVDEQFSGEVEIPTLTPMYTARRR
jgi:SAM-dependent methyltransferase